MQLRSNGPGVVAALALAAALCGCANIDFDSQQAWFAKPLDLAGRNAGGYTFSELAETKQRQHPITANDLVDGKGSCPPPAASAPQPVPGNPAAPAPDTGALLGGGIALGMSECDVVFRAGQPASVEIGNKPNGDRVAVLRYVSGPRPGVYHFEHGELMQMDRVAQPAAAAQPEKKNTAKNKPQKKSDQT